MSARDVVVVSEPSRTVVVIEQADQPVVEVIEGGTTNVITVVDVGPQGPIGPEGPAGASTDPSLYFQVVNRFYEIAEDEIAKATARTNLGIAIVDGGTFN